MTVSELLASNEFIALVARAYKVFGKSLYVKDFDEVVQNTALTLLKYIREFPSKYSYTTIVFRTVLWSNSKQRLLGKNADIVDGMNNSITGSVEVQDNYSGFDLIDNIDFFEEASEYLSEKEKKVLGIFLSGHKRKEAQRRTNLSKSRIDQITRKIEKAGRKADEEVSRTLFDGQVQR